jgi:hypothetical protein
LLRHQVAKQSRIYLHEIRVALKTELKIDVSEWTLCNACLPRVEADSKRMTLIEAKQEREDVACSRPKLRHIRQEIHPDRVVFIDETRAKTNMTRTYGRSAIGTRVVEGVPFGRWETTTFVGALRSTDLVAPLTVDSAVKTRVSGVVPAGVGPDAATRRHCCDG